MKLKLALLILFSFLLVSCSESDRPIVYENLTINNDTYELMMFQQDDLNQNSPDHTIIVEDITNFLITGTDLGEVSFPDLHIQLSEQN